jgi:hypothetical protein
MTLAPSEVTNNLTVLRHIQRAERDARVAAEKRAWERAQMTTPQPRGLEQGAYNHRRRGDYVPSSE